ncbi:WD repeat-containing protein 35-like [Diorhabda sublineata]|uniref:WD repeat-containing protein 35-like n=1 Tax=Diorhabda sublineata TaxID=1163346 RepID=UPI0024E081A5|nr:WD repeat-containing protein 35-like [Diorhabda sublineata]
MFAYLSKKIAIPNDTKINAIAWNKLDGYIAVAGENGLLKIFKLKSPKKDDQKLGNKDPTETNSLSTDQIFEAYIENIELAVWNELHEKLTTSDKNGLIIVWMFYKNVWYEEMRYNRKQSIVVGMAWSADGQKICITYEDGIAIVACIEGYRIWSRKLLSTPLSGVQWSPDSKFLLFSLKTGDLHLYDHQGNFMTKLNVFCQNTSSGVVHIVGLAWYNGVNRSVYSSCPNLSITFENGKTQLMKNESDTSPIIVDTRMLAVHCSWNHDGSLLAICGRQCVEEKQMNLVQFYSPFGRHLKTLKVPGNLITCCVWEGESKRVAIAVDSFIYLANVQLDYKWCYFKNTLVFSSFRPEKPGICITFWDTCNNQCRIKWVHELLGIAGCGEYCIIATKSDNKDPLGEYGLILYNTLGNPVSGIYIDFEPIAIGISSYQVFASSKSNFIVWYFKTPKSISASKNRIKMFHIDDSPSYAVEIIPELESARDIPVNTNETIDPVCCLIASDKYLIIGRDSALIQIYVLPALVLTNKIKISTRPYKMAINCTSTHLAIIDIFGLMRVLDISEGLGRPVSSSTDSKLERKDVWAMCWASDNPQLLAIMEKTRMYIFRGICLEEPVAFSGYLCSFTDLEIQAVLLDKVIEHPEKPLKDHIIKIEMKSLRDTKQLLEIAGINEASQFVEENEHPRLWCLIAETALKQMNLIMAETCFAKAKNYSKVLFVKKLQDTHNYLIRRARIAAYFKNYDEAENIYVEADRSDLALKLRQTLGDWFRVIQILKSGVTASDTVLQTAYNAIADYFVQLNNWTSAIKYYELGKNTGKLVEGYYHLEDWKNLDAMIDCLPEGDPLLERIGDMFAANAVHNEAVKAYVKVGKVISAINLCVMYNRWDVASDLAKTYNISKVSELVTKYTTDLVEQGEIINAIRINAEAKYYLLAAEQVFKLATKESQMYDKNLLRIKKYYVYAARLVELYEKPESGDWQSTDKLMLENAWKGAEAYHYYMMCQRYLFEEKPHEALCTAYKLQDYQDYIRPVDVYSLLTLAAYLDRTYGVCSKALLKLKSLENISEIEQNLYEKLSFDVFADNKPINPNTKMMCCNQCANLIHDWNTQCPDCNLHFPTCIATGRSIMGRKIWFCKVCKHSASELEMMNQNICPLCHAKN